MGDHLDHLFHRHVQHNLLVLAFLLSERGVFHLGEDLGEVPLHGASAIHSICPLAVPSYVAFLAGPALLSQGC